MAEEEHGRILNLARKSGGADGIDKTLEENDVDVIIGPGDGPLSAISAAAV